MARTPKDAIVLCLDVGPGMAQAPPGCDTPIESSLKIISMMLQRKIFSESKDEIALVLFGTEDTLNNLADDDEEGYRNIYVEQSLGIPGFDLLEKVSKIRPGSEETDFLDAVTVSLDILHEQTKGKNIEFRRLVLFTNFDHRFSDDNLEGIIGGFNCENEEVQLNVIAPQFEEKLPSSDADNNDSGSDGEGPSVKRFKQDEKHTLSEKPKKPQQRAGERLIARLFQEEVEGCAYSYDQAVIALTGFEKKSVRSVAWKCHLTIGSDLTIPCAAFVKTKVATLKKSWIKCYAKTQKSDDLMKQRYYVVKNDPQTEVDADNISKGYKYGKDVIPFSKNDEEQMKYQTDGKCLSILGFTNSSNMRIQDLMDDQAHYVLPEKDDEAAEAALTALVTAMNNQGMCAVARYVYRKGTNPKLMALLPRVKESSRYLVMVALPFVEDLRSLDFPSLETKKNPAPSAQQLSAVDNLIDNMDLCKDDKELYRPQEMLNPSFQRIYHCLNHRAVNPSTPMPAPDQRIANILSPNQQILEMSKLAAAEVKQCFTLEKQEIKQKKAAAVDTWADVTVDGVKSELNQFAGGDASSNVASISQITNTAVVQTVGSVSPVQDFITLLKSTTDDSSIRRVFEQLQQRIFEFILDPFNTGCDKKVTQCLKVMKEEAISKLQREIYNNFLKKLKGMLIGDDAVKRQYWNEIVSMSISLIEGGDVDGEEVANFLSENIQDNNAGGGKSEDEEPEEDVDDLLDEL